MSGAGPSGYPSPSALLIVNERVGPRDLEPTRGLGLAFVGRGGLDAVGFGAGVDGALEGAFAAFAGVGAGALAGAGCAGADVADAGDTEENGPRAPDAMFRSLSAPVCGSTWYLPDCSCVLNAAVGPDCVDADVAVGGGAFGPGDGVPLSPPVATLT